MKIGFRIPDTANELPFDTLCRWASTNRFYSLDLGSIDESKRTTMQTLDIEIGTVDIFSLCGLFGNDIEVEKAYAEGEAIMDSAKANGASKLFTVLFPRDGSIGRAQLWARFKETFGLVVKELESRGLKLAVEGWPGPSPHYGSMAVTPEMVRALLKVFPSEAVCLNYDPSHLIRLGIDYLRFLDEFGDRVIHVHGKDTTFDSEAMYQYGMLGPNLSKPKPFGLDAWRYCIPGEGNADWAKIAAKLDSLGYNDIVSIELEDFRYSGAWELEASGLLKARTHLEQFV